MNILIIEDNLEILEILQLYFPDAKTASLIKDIPFHENFDLVIADRMLPDGDVLDYSHLFKEKETPIIMISSFWKECDVIKAIKHDIDRYITKPFSVHILKAYVDFFQRQQSEILNFKDIQIDKTKKLAYFNKKPLNLTLAEITILGFLIENQSEIIRRDVLLKKIGKDVKSRAIDIQIVKLRKKIPYGDNIKTVHGKGYKLVS